jgi:HAMP domain-containing protein
MAPEHTPSDEDWERMTTNERLQAAADLLNHFKGVPQLPKDEAEEAAQAVRRLAQRVEAHDRHQREQERQ